MSLLVSRFKRKAQDQTVLRGIVYSNTDGFFVHMSALNIGSIGLVRMEFAYHPGLRLEPKFTFARDEADVDNLIGGCLVVWSEEFRVLDEVCVYISSGGSLTVAPITDWRFLQAVLAASACVAKEIDPNYKSSYRDLEKWALRDLLKRMDVTLRVQSMLLSNTMQTVG